MSDKLEELKKKFIIDEEEYGDERISRMIEMVNRFVKVGKTGKVFIEDQDLTNKEKVGLSIIGRYLANYLEDEIRKSISNDELQEYLGIEGTQVSARVSELKKEGLTENTAKGEYRLSALYKAKQFLEQVTDKYEG